MKDETKEILDIFKTLIEEYSPITAPFELENYEIEYSQIKSLLDDITNLQEKNKNRISESLAYDLAVARVKELEYRIDKAVVIIQNDTALNSQSQRERLINTLTGGDE